MSPFVFKPAGQARPPSHGDLVLPTIFAGMISALTVAAIAARPLLRP